MKLEIYVTGDWSGEGPFARIEAESAEIAKKAVAKASGINVLRLQAFEADGDVDEEAEADHFLHPDR